MIPTSRGLRGFARPGRSPGFSLLELMLTITLIAILMIVVYGGNARSRQQRKMAACHKNLQLIATATQLYAGDHAGKLPAVSSSATASDEPLSLLVPRYTSLTAPFICPGSRDKHLPEGESFRGRRISYAYYMDQSPASPPRSPGLAATTPLLTDWQVDSRLKVVGDPLFSPDGKAPGNNHDRFGGNIFFMDGHTEKSPPRASVALPLDDNVILLNPRK